MAIDISSETLVTFSQAAALLPNRPSLATIFRWRARGIRGAKLETVRIGGGRYTSVQALERFAAAVTAVADGQAPQARTSRQRQRDIEEVKRQLDAARI
jgi:hypothetical protein